MRITKAVAGLIVLAAAAAGQTAPLSAYRLSFTVHETDNGKRVDSKTYTMLVEDGRSGKINVGNRVPLETGGSGNWTYIDVGMNLRCTLQEREGQVRLNTEVSVSNTSADGEGRPAARPIIRQIQSTVDSVVPPGKPTPIITLDDPASKRHYDFEVTATKVR